MAYVAFQPVPVPQVNFVRVKWLGADGTPVPATMEQAEELANRLRAIYPINGLDWISTELAWPNNGSPNLASLLDAVEYQRFPDGASWVRFRPARTAKCSDSTPGKA